MNGAGNIDRRPANEMRGNEAEMLGPEKREGRKMVRLVSR